MKKNDSRSVGLKIELASKESEKELQNMQDNPRHNNYNQVDLKTPELIYLLTSESL